MTHDEKREAVGPGLIDLCYTIFMHARFGTNGDDGAPVDWFNDTKPMAERLIAALNPPPATPPEAVDAISLAQPAGDAWKEAVLNELIVAHIYSAKHDADPRLAIHDAIAWNVQVALDPAVSQAARDLQSGDAVLREALNGLLALYADDEGCRSLPEYKAALAALASPPVEGEG